MVSAFTQSAHARLRGEAMGRPAFRRLAAASKTTIGAHRRSSDPAYPPAQTSIEISGGPAGGDGQSNRHLPLRCQIRSTRLSLIVQPAWRSSAATLR